jgi:DNA-binding SARP family transcriptional activator
VRSEPHPAPAIVPAKIRPARERGLPRRRLEDMLSQGLWDRRLTVIAAPAGSGKTTLLSQFADSVAAPAAWYRAESSDATQDVILSYLHASLRTVLPSLQNGWKSVEDAAVALEQCPQRRVLLVIDDLHTIQGTPAEATFERLLAYTPPSLTVLAASRCSPNLTTIPRLRLSGEVLELGAEDLRFRTWEVERLFSEFYQDPLRPEDAGELARRTEGWAAGLKMFHLGTAGKSAGQRKERLAALGVRSRLAREYLARNVLEDLPSRLREFLLGTCVLSRLSASLCDQLLERSGSEACLQELERRQIFTVAVEDTGGFRYHEALRSHLEGVMLDEFGEAEVQRRYRRAGDLLEASGAASDALQAYSRGGDWESVGRLLGQEGEQIALGGADWLHLLPPSLSLQDPWVLLATARRHRACGRWSRALETYRAAEATFGSQTGVEHCVRERLALASWLEPSRPSTEWNGVVRGAVAAAPQAAAEHALTLSGGHGLLGAGLAYLIAGNVVQARPLLRATAQSEDASPELAAGALLATAVAGALMGDAGAKHEAELASQQADRLGLPWIARMGQAVLALTDRPDGRSEAASVRIACLSHGDLWGAGLAGLLEGLGALWAGETRPSVLEEAAGMFATLAAPGLEAWCLCARALSLGHLHDPRTAATAQLAERSARFAGLRGPQAFAYLAMAMADPGGTPAAASWASDIARDTGLQLPAPANPATSGGQPPAQESPDDDAVVIRCLGGFTLCVGAARLDLGAVKPRVRKLLHLLALHTKQPVHREVLIESLWPEADPESGARNLHVAVSSLRQLLAVGSRGETLQIVREGEDYRLKLPPGSHTDVAAFAGSVEEGRHCRAAGDVPGAIRSLSAALDLYAGDLLPEDGPAEWVLGDRESLRASAVEAAGALAELLVAGDAAGAARACERGLAIDRCRDSLWRTLQRAHELAGNYAAAADARRRYERVLADLGVDPPVTVSRVLIPRSSRSGTPR